MTSHIFITLDWNVFTHAICNFNVGTVTMFDTKFVYRFMIYKDTTFYVPIFSNDLLVTVVKPEAEPIFGTNAILF
jgi:hypothetical protein